ncbi:Rho GTPase [Tieghemostelium lacteum]|uniref:Rho GTPase n=1 Tax=Tieghemostelium lacteum TaxID=361077 RepID=A0A151ZDU7_TIELA|nr:Rho GTPase [Tieghemostelium lacteum]|eukprot:KYQ92080.1 Rho GTPase [Tieghemostelium lacteum]
MKLYLVIILLLFLIKGYESITQAGYYQFKRYEQTIFQVSLIHPFEKYILLATTPGVIVKLYLTNSTSTFNAREHDGFSMNDNDDDMVDEELKKIQEQMIGGSMTLENIAVNHKYLGNIIKYPLNPSSQFTSLAFDENYLNVYLVTTYNEILLINLSTLEIVQATSQYSLDPTYVNEGIGRTFYCDGRIFVFQDSITTYLTQYNAETLVLENSFAYVSAPERSSLLDCPNRLAYVFTSTSSVGRLTTIYQLSLDNISVAIHNQTYPYLNHYCTFFYNQIPDVIYTLFQMTGTRGGGNLVLINVTNLSVISNTPLFNITNSEGLMYCDPDQQIQYVTAYCRFQKSIAFQFIPPSPTDTNLTTIATEIFWVTANGGQIISISPTSNPHLPPNLSILISCSFDMLSLYISTQPVCSFIFLSPNIENSSSSSSSLSSSSSSSSDMEQLTIVDPQVQYSLNLDLYFAFSSPPYNFISMVFKNTTSKLFISFQTTYKESTYIDILKISDPTDMGGSQVSSVISFVLGLTQPLQTFQISENTVYFFYTTVLQIVQSNPIQQLSVAVMTFNDISLEVYVAPILTSIQNYISITYISNTTEYHPTTQHDITASQTPQFLVYTTYDDTGKQGLKRFTIDAYGFYIEETHNTQKPLISMNQFANLIMPNTSYYYSAPDIYIYNYYNLSQPAISVVVNSSSTEFLGSFYDQVDQSMFILMLANSSSSGSKLFTKQYQQPSRLKSLTTTYVFQLFKFDLATNQITAKSTLFSLEFTKTNQPLTCSGAFKDETLGYYFLENGYVLTINTTDVSFYSANYIDSQYNLPSVQYDWTKNTAYIVESYGYLVEFLDCMAGSFRNSTSGDCQYCPEGTYSSKVGSSECTPCFAGMISSYYGQSKCLPCLPGQFSNIYRNACIECNGNTYTSSYNSTLCIECPTNSVPVQDHSQCICADGYYGQSINCQTCPTGANCTNGLLYLLPNYWSPIENYTDIYSCPMPGACIPGNNSGTVECANGYYGIECAGCINGWSLYINSCSQCPDSLFITYLVILIFFVCFISLLLVAYRAGIDVSFSALKILISYGQVISSISDTITTNQVLLEKLLTFVTFSNLDFLHILSLDCLLGRRVTYYERYWVMVFTPLIIIILIALFHYIFQLAKKVIQMIKSRKRRNKKPSITSSTPNLHEPLQTQEKDSLLTSPSTSSTTDPNGQSEYSYFDLRKSTNINFIPKRSKYKRAPSVSNSSGTGRRFKLQHPNTDALFRDVLLILLLSYPAVCQSILDMYSCVEIDGTYYLESDLNTLCQGIQWQVHAYINIVFIMIYPVGIPLLFFILLYLWKQKKWISEEKCKERLSLLFSSYKDNFWYWEVVELIRKLLLTSAVSISFRGTSGTGIFNKNAINVFICVLAVFFQNQFKPFKDRTDNLLQLNSLSMIYFMYFFLVISASEPSNSLSIQNLDTADSIVLLVLGAVVGVHGLLLGIQYIRRFWPKIKSALYNVKEKIKNFSFTALKAKLFNKKPDESDLSDDASYSFSDESSHNNYDYYQSILNPDESNVIISSHRSTDFNNPNIDRDSQL